MQALIQQFVQYTIARGYHMERIRGVDLIGSTEENVPDIEEVKFHASYRNGLVTDIDEVMTSFRAMLGEPISSEFFISTGKDYPFGLFNVGKIIGPKNIVGPFILLNGPPKDSWAIIHQLKDTIGEPKKGVWELSLAYSWYISLD